MRWVTTLCEVTSQWSHLVDMTCVPALSNPLHLFCRFPCCCFASLFASIVKSTGLDSFIFVPLLSVEQSAILLGGFMHVSKTTGTGMNVDCTISAVRVVLLYCWDLSTAPWGTFLCTPSLHKRHRWGSPGLPPLCRADSFHILYLSSRPFLPIIVIHHIFYSPS